MNRRAMLQSAACLAAGVGLARDNRATAADTGTAGDDSGARGPGNEVVFIVAVHVRPGHEAEFLRLLTPVLDAMRHEPTFVNAVLHQDPEDPTRFMLYETWADLEDVVQVQIHRDYRRAYLARLPEILREERQIQIWRPLRGDFRFSAAGETSGAKRRG